MQQKSEKRLFIFDMDGTLIMNSTGPVEISKITKTEKYLKQLEEQFDNEIITTKDFSKALYNKWGILDKSVIKTAFDASKKIRNIKEVTSHISKSGNLSCLITMSPDVFADHFHEFGFDYIFATGYPKSKDKPYDKNKTLEPADKERLSRKVCEQNNIIFERSVAFGDSLSDKLLFEKLEETVCVNGHDSLKKISKHSYSGDDLMVPYKKVIYSLYRYV